MTSVFLVGLLDLHSMRCKLPDVSSWEEYQQGVEYHLWSHSCGLQSASSQLSLRKEGNNWEQSHQTDPAHICDFVFSKGVLGFLEAFLHVWKIERLQEVPFLLFVHPKSCRGKSGKMIHPAWMSEYHSPSLLPCQDGTGYTYIFPDSFVFMWVFSII